MNAWKISIFVYGIQSMILLAGLANIPISCPPGVTDIDQCLILNENIIGSTSLHAIGANEVDTGQYTSTKVATNVFGFDFFTATVTTLDKMVSMVSFMFLGVYQLIRFFFGFSDLTHWIGLIMQGFVHFFFIRAIISVIRGDGGGNISG